MSSSIETIIYSQDENVYKKRIQAWIMYDWANSAFATTILAAVLPAFYSQVAGATLSSPAVATAYWSSGLWISLLIVAILAPILGTISDISRTKKKFFGFFFSIGIVGTGLLFLVQRGDWLMASILFVIGRIGFTGSNVFYDAFLPHVAKEKDRDSVSTRGYAFGYLGGGLLLAINIVMIQVIGGELGSRLSFLSVAIWWSLFTIPLFRNVPEPATAPVHLAPGENVITHAFRRLVKTFKDMKHYSELFKFLLSFLIYNDGIGTIIGMAVIYGTELGFGTTELILALLLVQFVGIPFSLIFGKLPDSREKRRPFFLAFIIFNIVALPVAGILGSRLLPIDTTGAKPPEFQSEGGLMTVGMYTAYDGDVTVTGNWDQLELTADVLGSDEAQVYAIASEIDTMYTFEYFGEDVEITYGQGPDQGIWQLYVDEELYQDDDGNPIVFDGYSDVVRYGLAQKIDLDESGAHTIKVVNSGERNEKATGNGINVFSVRVLEKARSSNLLYILGLIAVVEAGGLLFALLFGNLIFTNLANSMNTKRSILLGLIVYSVIAVWAFFLDSVFEYWFLAFMVAIVQGGSQALSRSLFSIMSPSAKSGEFFGLFGVMEKFSAIFGPMIFGAVALTYGSSRPAILSIIIFFIIGGVLLSRVDVEKGRITAREEDEMLLGASES